MSTNANPIIVTSRELPPMFREALARVAEVRVATDGAGDEVFDGAAVYLNAGVDPVPAEMIGRFPTTIGLIANIATGTDNIDLAAARARGIAVSNTPVVAEDTADLTMTLLLAACRQLSFCERSLREGDWAAGTSRLSLRVHGKTLGLVGLGAIGQAVARRAAAFNMRVLYNGPRPKPEAEAALGVEFRDQLDTLLAESDIVSLHCPLTEETRHLIDAAALSRMKPGAVLVNTGRGPLVDEGALVGALSEGRLAAAGLDVFEAEPEIHAGLLELENVTLAPHIGSATTECRIDMALRALANIEAHLKSGSPIDRVV